MRKRRPPAVRSILTCSHDPVLWVDSRACAGRSSQLVMVTILPTTAPQTLGRPRRSLCNSSLPAFRSHAMLTVQYLRIIGSPR